MLGVLIQLSISWLLLYLFEKKDLSVLGITPTKARGIDFVLGFMAAAGCFTVYCLTTTTLTDNAWSLNNEYTAWQFTKSSWWTFNAVLFEELIFRGALLYILIQRSGWKKACLVSAAAFGIYHWFSFGVLGNPVQMAYVFFYTGIWGLMYAFSFAKTGSLYLPVGLHLGWNLFNIVVFSRGPLGEQLLISENNGQLLGSTPSALLQVFQLFAIPIVVYRYLRKRTQHNPSKK